MSKTWVKWLVAVIGLSLAAGLVVAVYASGQRALAMALGGGFSMVGAFFLGLALIRLILRPSFGITGIARTLVDEAIRMKVALVFIVALLLIVPALPFLMDPKELLKYRLQFFLTWSVSAVSILLSLMTVFLACATVCNEISERQVFLTMTKPVSRAEYLAGKWLGIVLLNAVLVAVAGGGVYTFAKILGEQPARSNEDAVAVREQVLTARNVVDPIPPGENGLQPMYDARVEELRREFPHEYGEKITPEQQRAIRQQVMLKWHTVPAMDGMPYLFTGLGNAKAMGPTIQLRLKPKASPTPADEKVRLAVRLNGRWYQRDPSQQTPEQAVANDIAYVIDIPSDIVDEQGNLVVEIINAHQPGPPDIENPQGARPASISFTPGEGLQVLYRVDSFEANLARGMAMLWLRLSFLAMLGIAAGTFLSFPVACLLCLLVYFTSAGSAYLAESISSYGGSVAPNATLMDWILWPFTETWKHLVEGKVWDAVKVWIKLVGAGFMALVPSLGEYNPIQAINDGRLISWQWLGRAAGNVGVLWTAAVWAVGWLIFRKRELARVTV